MNNILTKSRSLVLLAMLSFGLTGTTQAGTAYVKANNTNALNTSASYTVSGTPSLINGDTVTWNSLVNGPLTNALGGNLGMAGMIISSPGGAITVSASNTLTLGGLGIDMSGATTNLTLNPSLAIVSNQNWTVNGGLMLTAIAGGASSTGSGTGNINMLQVGTGTAVIIFNQNGNAALGWSNYSGTITVGANVLARSQGTNLAPWGTGTVVLDGGAVSEYNGNWDFGNAFMVTANGGTIQNDNTSTATTRYVDIPGVLSGSGPLTIGGSSVSGSAWGGTLGVMLGGSNTYSGTITISGTGGGYFSAGVLTVGSAAKTNLLSNAYGTNGSINNVTSIIDNGTLVIGRTDGYMLPAGLVISGSGAFTVGIGCAATIPSTANTYSGATTVGGGSLTVVTLNSVNGGSPSSSLGAPGNPGQGTIPVGSSTNGGALVIAGTGETSDRVINLAGTTGGAMICQSGSGPLILSCPYWTATGAGSKTLILTNTTTAMAQIEGQIPDNGGANKTSVLKTGNGLWILSGANTYSGATTINNGILEVDGSIGGGTIQVNGGTLDGSGSLSGSVMISSGTLAPGTASGMGTLSIYNALALSGNAVVAMRISKTGGATTSDSLSGMTTVNYGGTLTVSNITSDTNLLAAGDSFQLFSGSAYGGGFTNISLPTLPVGLSWNLSGLSANGSIAVTANAATPAFSPSSGGFVGTLPVTITSSSGAIIHFTTDGTDPATSSTVMSGASPVTVTVPANTANETITAYATKTGTGSSLENSATYSTVANPTWINIYGGYWSSAGNWSNNVVANASSVTANFSQLTLSSDTYITLDIPATVGSLVFGDQGDSFNWFLEDGGAGPLTLDAGTNTPVINVIDTNTTIAAVLSGTSGLIKTGLGTLTLTGVNNYAGGTEIKAGTLQIDNGADGTATAGTGVIQIDTNTTLIFNYGAAASAFVNNINGSGTIVVNGEGPLATGGQVGLNGSNTFSGLIQINTNKLALNGSNSGNGAPRIAVASDGLFSIGSGYAGATLTISELSGAGLINPQFGSTTGVRTLLVNQTSSTVFSGAMSDTTSSRYMALIKSGPGTLVLSGTNTFTNFTTISNGVLEVDGALASGTVMVMGGTLDGSGTLAGSVMMTNGVLSAGSATNMGTLFISNTLTLSDGTVAMRISKTGGAAVSDNFSGLTSVTYSGTLTVTNVTSDTNLLAVGDTFTLFSFTPGDETGNFVATNLPSLGSGLAWNWNPATGTLAVVVGSTVNTTPVNIKSSYAGGILSLSWPSDHLGWRLDMQANPPGAGLSTNASDWVTVPNSTSVTSTNLPISHSYGSVFYRLVYP